MALQVQVCRLPPMAPPTGPVVVQSGGGNLLWCTKRSAGCDRATGLVSGKYNNKRVSLKVMCSLDTTADTAVEVVVGQVTEVSKDTFWPIVKAAGDKVVVLDMFTQWCGPCKVIAPKYQQLSEQYLDTVFLKLDCNNDNRPLAKELGLKVVPTFKILKGGKVVKEVTGAKYDVLLAAIDGVRSS